MLLISQDLILPRLTTYRCKKTGAIYQTKEDALNFGVKLEDLAQDVVAKLPKLDLFNDLK